MSHASRTHRHNLRRLLAPRHIAVFGGRPAAEVIRQCRQVGFAGELWPVHPYHDSIEGLTCFRAVDELPEAPDAAFVAVPREPTVDIVAALARRGAGGAVCYASGFAEAGGEGSARQRGLIEAAGAMAILGPNCYGVLNYLDRAALWPDQHGGTPVERGVAIVTQSGNLAVNLTMQRRSLPLAYVISLGNAAGAGLPEIVDALLDDRRITAIGLHIEGLDDVAGFSRVAIRALTRRVPLVALKSGSSELGALATLAHSSSLAGPDDLYDALFARLGVARVHDPVGLLETLKLLSVHGARKGTRIASASCSGGEASLVADLAQPRGLTLPAFPPAVRHRLRAVLGEAVAIANPLDYHTYIWGDRRAQTECFAGLLSAGFDAHLLVVDLPREDRCVPEDWETTLAAFIAATRRVGGPACVVSSLPEGLPEHVGARLLAEGIAPMQGLPECLDAIRAAALIGAAQARAGDVRPVTPAPRSPGTTPLLLDEWNAKRALAALGLPVPEGALVGAEEAGPYADKLGYPVVVKAVSTSLPHKTEAGAVHLNLCGVDDVRGAVGRMSGLSDRFLVERMVQDTVAELIVGARHDPRFGLVLTVGAGGVLVELLRDVAQLLLPASRQEVRAALASLTIWPLLNGYRGRPPGDVAAVLDAVSVIARYAETHAGRLIELDVNPLLVRPEGHGVLAADALIRLAADHG
ncbi:acetate--CoA ligase family protein [Nonomuraea sp. NPDC026600]|uniref:acetate--CoA ligase family protein n=1 Tax=Nonomuraea sp. NPDC026600 TaxID=3155363 RepID=UPI0033E520AB